MGFLLGAAGELQARDSSARIDLVCRRGRSYDYSHTDFDGQTPATMALMKRPTFRPQQYASIPLLRGGYAEATHEGADHGGDFGEECTSQGEDGAAAMDEGAGLGGEFTEEHSVQGGREGLSVCGSKEQGGGALADPIARTSIGAERAELMSLINTYADDFSFFLGCANAKRLNELVPMQKTDRLQFLPGLIRKTSTFFRLICAYCLECPPYGIITRHSHSANAAYSESVCIHCFLYEPKFRIDDMTKAYQDVFVFRTRDSWLGLWHKLFPDVSALESAVFQAMEQSSNPTAGVDLVQKLIQFKTKSKDICRAPATTRADRLVVAQHEIDAAYHAVPTVLQAYPLFQGRPELVTLNPSAWLESQLSGLVRDFFENPLRGFSSVTGRNMKKFTLRKRFDPLSRIIDNRQDASAQFYEPHTTLTASTASEAMKIFCAAEVSPDLVLQGADLALWPSARELWNRLLVIANSTCRSLVEDDLMAEKQYQDEHSCESHQIYISHGAPGNQVEVSRAVEALVFAVYKIADLVGRSLLVIAALYPLFSAPCFKLAAGGATGLHVDKTSAANCAVRALAANVPPHCVVAIWCLFHPSQFAIICNYIWTTYNATCWRVTVLLDAADFAALALLGVVPMWLFQRPADIITIPAFCIHLVFNVVSNLKFAADSVSVWALRLQHTLQRVQVLTDGDQDLAHEIKNKCERKKGEVGGSIAQSGILTMLRLTEVLSRNDSA